MSEWNFLTLKEAELEFIDGDRGVNYPKKSELLPEGDCVFLNTGNVRQNSFDFSNLDFITKEKDNLLRNGKLQRDDIVLTTRGTVGNVALYSQEVPFSNIRINSGMVIIRVNRNFWHPYFVYLFFQSHLFKKQISRLISGSAQPQLPISILETVSIPQLTLDEQKEIIFNIKSIDQKIQINNQINQELEAMAKTLYDYWFVQFDFPDQNGNPYKSSGGKMVYNPELKREIPDGWGVTKLNEVVDLISGYPFSSNDYVTSGKYKLYTIKNVQDGYTVDKVDNYLDFLPSNMSHECQLRRGDLIMSLTGNVGRVGMVYEDDVLLNQRVLKLNPINKTHKSFIYSFFRSDVTKAHLENMSTGTSQKNLSPIDIGNMMIPFPSESLLSKFLDNLNMLENNLVENQQLTKLRDWLLPMLMNGQVKVK